MHPATLGHDEHTGLKLDDDDDDVCMACMQ